MLFANVYHFIPSPQVMEKLKNDLIKRIVFKSAPHVINEEILKRYQITAEKNAVKAMEKQDEWWIFEGDFLSEKQNRKIKALLH
ncbi:MAG: hypothetical protein MUE99_10875 [Chitinophagaceae bacterium]|nr:hypothetical protein [Chitinophagaceae bacterium]